MEEHRTNTQTRGWHRLARKRAGVVFSVAATCPWEVQSVVPVTLTVLSQHTAPIIPSHHAQSSGAWIMATPLRRERLMG